MICENCKERPAQIHLTQIVDNKVTTMHLCEECAADKGVQTGAAAVKFPLTDFIASIGGKQVGESMPAEVDAGQCPNCGATLDDFRQTGQLGCPRCYDAFADPLKDLFRKIHGSHQHVGEVYQSSGPGSDSIKRVFELRRQLKRAIDSENFELAAEIRDQLQVLEK